MTRTVPTFSVWEVMLGLIVAVGAQAGGLLLLRTGGGSAGRADISDERVRPMSVAITPVVDDAPALKLGSKRPAALPDRWVAPKPVERAVTPPAPTQHTPPAPKTASTAASLDAGPPPAAPTAEPAKAIDQALVVPEAGPPPVATTEGAPDGIREGTETDPLKAHAISLYRAQLSNWFANRVHFKGKLPFDTLKDLRATATVNVGPDRTVTSFDVVQPSGNPIFDGELNTSLSQIVADGIELPAPPPNYADILGTTQRIQFRCDQRSQCE